MQDIKKILKGLAEDGMSRQGIAFLLALYNLVKSGNLKNDIRVIREDSKHEQD